MADYADARAVIATILAGVSITTPVAASMQTVYERRPDAGEGLGGPFPAVLITGATIAVSRSSGLKERAYTVGMRLVVRPIDNAPMQDLLDAFKEAIIAAFDVVALGSTGYHVVSGPDWIQKEPFIDGGSQWEEAEMVIRTNGSF